MRKRSVLLIATAILLTGNGVFFWDRLGGASNTQIKTEWIAYSPTLEGELRDDPAKILTSSEWVDPRYAQVRDKEDPRLNLLVRTAVTCSVSQWSLATYFPNDPTNPTADMPTQMPDRLFFGAMNQRQQSCVVRNLPPGYRLAKLAGAAVENETNWSAPNLEESEQPSNRNGTS